jgi:hypothetical protein
MRCGTVAKAGYEVEGTPVINKSQNKGRTESLKIICTKGSYIFFSSADP